MKRFVAIVGRSYDTWLMRLLLTLLTIATLCGLPGSAAAFDLERSLMQLHVQYEEPDSLTTVQANGMSLAQATESIRKRTGGKVLSAETRVQGGREVHHIKVLKDGKVKTYKVNGRRR